MSFILINLPSTIPLIYGRNEEGFPVSRKRKRLGNNNFSSFSSSAKKRKTKERSRDLDKIQEAIRHIPFKNFLESAVLIKRTSISEVDTTYLLLPHRKNVLIFEKEKILGKGSYKKAYQYHQIGEYLPPKIVQQVSLNLPKVAIIKAKAKEDATKRVFLRVSEILLEHALFQSVCLPLYRLQQHKRSKRWEVIQSKSDSRGDPLVGEFVYVEKVGEDHLLNYVSKRHFATDALCHRCFLSIARQLRDLHTNHLCHMDINPYNILIYRDKQGKIDPRLSDFDSLIDTRKTKVPIYYGAPRFLPLECGKKTETNYNPACQDKPFLPSQLKKIEIFCLAATFVMVYSFAYKKIHSLTFEKTDTDQNKNIARYRTTLERLPLPLSLKELLGRMLSDNPNRRPGAAKVVNVLLQLDL